MFNALALGEKIKYYRTIKGLSQTELGELCNMSQSVISDFELGNTSAVGIGKLYIVAEALDVTVDDLLCDSIDALCENQISEVSPYEVKLNQLLLTLDESDINFYNQFLKDYVRLKQSL